MKMRMYHTVRDMFATGKLSKETSDMVFDWERAATVISERKPFVAYAALGSQKEKIYQGGFPVYSETVHSEQLMPMLIVNDECPIPCFKMEYDTNGMEVWPKKALDILEERL